MTTRGRITAIHEDGTCTIIAPIDIAKVVHQHIKEAYIEPIDGRVLSDKQRRMCYSLINAIAEWSGSSTQDIKEAFKMEFWADKVETIRDKIFSLSNAPMSLIAEFQRFLISFALENNVSVKRPLLEYVDDVNHYVYMCLIHKKCAICGKKADLHHIDAIGMGNDRSETIHEGREAISLCREHHTEYHTIGKTEFFQKYHLDSGVKIDKTLLKIYNLKK